METIRFQEEIKDTLEMIDVFMEIDECDIYIDDVRSYDNILIVELSDGSKFQMTITQL